MAAIRAVESTRKDALFADPFAAALAGEKAIAWLQHQPIDLGLWPVIRTRFLDDFLDYWIQQRHIRQVVLLAAGLDTRAFRLNWPEDAYVYEIDQAEVMHYKEHILAQEHAIAKPKRKCLSIKLEQAWEQELISTGFDAGQPSIWILEGLLYYLQAEMVQQVMEAVTRLSAVGSQLGLDLINQAFLISGITQASQEQRSRMGIPWRFGVNDPQQWLLEFGWEANVSTLGEVAKRYGRWPYPSPSSSRSDTSRWPCTFFITAHREKVLA